MYLCTCKGNVWQGQASGADPGGGGGGGGAIRAKAPPF